jgi:D-3-phosphoglycerate dehydrogenase
MQGLFLDATAELAGVFEAVVRPDDPPVRVNRQADVAADALAGLLAGYDFVLDDHTALPTATVRRCPGLRHVIFLGTGARSYMSPEELAGLGITVHTIKGYGDTAVAEHTIALMWAAARGVAGMDSAVRAGLWPRTEGVQLTGKTLGLLGFGGIAAEVARIAAGSGMRVLAWNRTPKSAPGVTFVDLDTLLAESDVLSLHLVLTEATRGFLSATRLDEAALLAALRNGRLRHAALDVFHEEPLPAGHVLTSLANVTLTAHSAFRTPEAGRTLVRMALDIARRLAV